MREMYFWICLSVKVVSERINEGVEVLPFASQTGWECTIQGERELVSNALLCSPSWPTVSELLFIRPSQCAGLKSLEPWDKTNPSSFKTGSAVCHTNEVFSYRYQYQDSQLPLFLTF